MADETVNALNDLIETSKDGEKGFTRAADEASDATLKTLFRQGAERCRTAVQELQTQVTALGGKPEEHGSLLGAAHRGWLEVKAAVSRRDDLAILEECERGEDVAKARYTAALRKDLTSPVRALIERQFAGVRENHDRVKALRDQYRAK